MKNISQFRVCRTEAGSEPENGFIRFKYMKLNHLRFLFSLGLLLRACCLAAAEATPASALKVADGFTVELLKSAGPGEGSWVNLTVDPMGRLIVSPQGAEPMLRLTLDAAGHVAKTETIDLPVTGAMGLLAAYNALYVNGRGPDGYHFYRLTDTDGDDRYDKVELLRKWNGGDGEHGAHGIVKGPDGDLYIVCGNFVDVPNDIAETSPLRNYADDLVVPRMEDGNGFGAGRKPPGGFVLRVDKDGKNPVLFAAGERNTYDIAFNPEGDLFGFDSDMEWDWGTPWYRPTRVYHVVSGGDQGFREGSAKWPEYYQDSLPAVLNIGIGSPTGIKFATGAHFPTAYQRALFVLDWSYGRIMAVHLSAKGASYTATVEDFVKGKPLNVTDLEFGPDGSMYFTTGGRGTQAGLYRVSYVGAPGIGGEPAPDSQAAAARRARHELEAYHGRVAIGAVKAAWKHLGSPDRHLRYAARLVLESQPVPEWRQKALDEEDSTAGLTAFLALARVGSDSDQLPMLKALSRWHLPTLDEEHQLLKLRVIEVSFVRHGIPEELRPMATERLNRIYPSPSWPVNRELSQLLVALGAPDVVAKTLDLRDAAQTQEEQLHYQTVLREAKVGWNSDLRKRYFEWFYTRPLARDGGATYPAGGNYRISSSRHPDFFVQWFKDVGLDAGNGASYENFLKNLRQKATAALSDDERGELAPWITGVAYKNAPSTQPVPKRQRSVVKEWTTADLAPLLPRASSGRSFEGGRAVYTEAQCAACHQFNGEGGAVGPALTGISSRFGRADIAKSIVEPSAVISEQYQSLTFTLKNGDEVTGRLVEDAADKFVVVTDPLKGTRAELKKADVAGKVASKVSPMPEGLLNAFTAEEILDLLAYLESNGKSDASQFKK
jgi:putative heme-binding domain-containing protein